MYRPIGRVPGQTKFGSARLPILGDAPQLGIFRLLGRADIVLPPLGGLQSLESGSGHGAEGVIAIDIVRFDDQI